MNPLDNSEVIMHELLPLISKCYQNKRFILRTQLGSQITNSNLTSPVKISQDTGQDFPSPDARHVHLQIPATGPQQDSVQDLGLMLYWCWLMRSGQDGWKGLPAPWPPGFHEMPHKAPSHRIPSHRLQYQESSATHPQVWQFFRDLTYL